MSDPSPDRDPAPDRDGALAPAVAGRRATPRNAVWLVVALVAALAVAAAAWVLGGGARRDGMTNDGNAGEPVFGGAAPANAPAPAPAGNGGGR